MKYMARLSGVAGFALVAGAAVALTACSPNATTKDVKNITFHDADLIQGYNNVDLYPNIVKVCVDGVAFATTTRDAQAAIQRIPEWDKTCPGYRAR